MFFSAANTSAAQWVIDSSQRIKFGILKLPGNYLALACERQ